MTDEERTEAEIKTPGLLAKVGGNGVTAVALALIAVIGWIAYLYTTTADPHPMLGVVIGLLMPFLGALCFALARRV